MTIDENMLFGFVDGTLDARAMEKVAMAIVSDTALGERVDRQVELVREIRTEMDRDLALPVPGLWTAAIDARVETPLGNLENLAAMGRKQVSWKLWQIGGAMLASLIIGITIGASTASPPAGLPGLIGEQGGQLVAGSELASALDTARSDRPYLLKDALSVDIKQSLRAGDGQFCRQAAVLGRDSVGVLACRNADGWRIVALTTQAQSESTGYVRTSGADPLDAAVAQLGGQPLDATEERAAIDNRWRLAK
jgi:hypothetical protein